MVECNKTPKKRKNESVASFRKRKAYHKKLTDEVTKIVFDTILSADYSKEYVHETAHGRRIKNAYVHSEMQKFFEGHFEEVEPLSYKVTKVRKKSKK